MGSKYLGNSGPQLEMMLILEKSNLKWQTKFCIPRLEGLDLSLQENLSFEIIFDAQIQLK